MKCTKIVFMVRSTRIRFVILSIRSLGRTKQTASQISDKDLSHLRTICKELIYVQLDSTIKSLLINSSLNLNYVMISLLLVKSGQINNGQLYFQLNQSGKVRISAEELFILEVSIIINGMKDSLLLRVVSSSLYLQSIFFVPVYEFFILEVSITSMV